MLTPWATCPFTRPTDTPQAKHALILATLELISVLDSLPAFTMAPRSARSLTAEYLATGVDPCKSSRDLRA